MTQASITTNLRQVHGTGADRSIRHLNQIDLSRRWNLSPRTLERWRWLKQGPDFLKIGGRVVYRVEDVEAYETAHRHHRSSVPNGNAA